MDHPDSLPPPTPPRTGTSAGDREGRSATIETLPAALKSVSRPTRIEGEVTQHNRDGSVRIRTAHGDIDLRFRGREVPAEGERVELQLPAGDPPRRATLKTLPPSTDRPAPQPLDNGPEATHPAQTSDPRPPAPRLSQELSQNLTERAAPPREILQIPLKTGDLVRLMPLPAETIDQFRERLLPANVEARLPWQSLLPITLALPDTPPAAISLPPTSSTSTAGLAATVQKIVETFPAFALTTPEQSTVDQKLVPTAPAQTNLPAGITLLPGLVVETDAASFPLLHKRTMEGIAGKNLPIDVRIESILPHFNLVDPQVASLHSLALEGKGLEARLLEISPGDDNKEIIKSAAKAGGFQAVILDKTPENLPIVKINSLPPYANLFVMQFPADNLSIGTMLELMPVPLPGMAAAGSAFTPGLKSGEAALAPPSLLPPLFSNFDWPALEELHRAVQQIAPAHSQNLSQSLPSPAAPNRLPLAALIFIAAVQGGDLSAWLGNKVTDTLRRAGRGDILERIGRDFSALQRTASEPVTQDWRALTVPLLWQEEMQQMHMYWRQDKSGDQNDKDKKGKTRFIFNLNLSRMGALQLDGLHRGQILDLIVRTKKPLSQTMQKAMRRQYSSALESAGIKGELHFQGKPESWVEIDARQAGTGLQT